MEFVNKLSVRKIPFVGRMTELILASLGIFYCKDVIEKATEIYSVFSEKQSQFLLRCALGISRNYHESDDEDAC